ncbi:hypothetical protein PR202_ga26513 [Eleusine coracana subsp. coracana]|uniref:Lecithin-cholesterol acyltransferase-like 1 n=1 Tax=Eleusine coracana subsp. coracana TaxID=191504 RepID=A0AAV5DF56_ELECO|nr:hypothetical protein PR202_ga26513 [Eleusine coracana subsp. coracana]
MSLALFLVIAAARLASPSRSHAGDASKNLHPVVLVPGYGSNLLEARVTAAYDPPAPSCTLAADQLGEWFQLWPNHTGMHDAAQAPCFADQMSLVYDAGADDYRNAADGVATRVPFFGSTRGLVGWDPLVRRLEALGYREGETLFAAPYDFRYAVAPRGHPSAVGARYFRDLARLLRRAWRLNRGRPAVLVAHSFGCALTYQFLLSRPLPWRRRHVGHAVLLGPALGGFAEGVDGLVTGTGCGLPNAAARPMKARARAERAEEPAERCPRRCPRRWCSGTYTARGHRERDLHGSRRHGVPRGDRVRGRGPAVRDAGAADVAGTAGAVGARDQRHRSRGRPERRSCSVSRGNRRDGMGGGSRSGQAGRLRLEPGVHHTGFFTDDFALTNVVAEIYEAGGSVQLDRDV